MAVWGGLTNNCVRTMGGKKDKKWFSIGGWGIDLDYCDIEWFALEMNRDYLVIFEIVPKYCILHSFVDYEGYSISPKGFLPTVVDIMVI